MGGLGNSIVTASTGRWALPATDSETAPSLSWFATIQGIECKQDPADVSPQRCFISAEAVECIIGQIDETRNWTASYFVVSSINAAIFAAQADPQSASISAVSRLNVMSLRRSAHI